MGWMISPQIDMSIFDGGRREANITLANYKEAQADIEYSQAILAAFNDVYKALATLESVIEQAGYQFRYSAVPGWYRTGSGEAIPRLLLEEGQSLSSVERWLKGGYDLYYSLKSRTL